MEQPEFTRGAPVEDLRGLEAPEPMVRILQAAARLAPGEVFVGRTPHYPAPLVAQLQTRTVDWAIHVLPDGSALVRLIGVPR